MLDRVLFVDLSSKAGGAERSIRELIAGLIPVYGGTIAFASAIEAEVSSRCRVYHVPGVRLHRPSFTRNFFRSVRSLAVARRTLRMIVRDVKPDVIVANGISAIFALPRTKAKVIWYVRDMPRRPYAGVAASYADHIVVISRAVLERCRRCIPGRLHNRLTVVENGIDLSRFAAVRTQDSVRSDLAVPSGIFAVGMIANFVPWKRHDLFVDIAAVVAKNLSTAHGNIKWIIAGDDLFGEHAEYVGELKRKIAELDMADDFLWVQGKDAAEVIPALDVIVHPAQDEPFGRVICEAMACGVPVVTSRSGGPGEIIIDGETGLLVDSPAPGDFAARILQLMNDRELRVRIIDRARRDVAEKFSIDRVVGDFGKLLRDVGSEMFK